MRLEPPSKEGYFQLKLGVVVMPPRRMSMRKISKLVFSLAVCLAGCVVSGAPLVAAPGKQQQGTPPSEIPPSPLEAFASRPTARVIWSKKIGSLESSEARATVTALIVEDTTSRPDVMRGLQIDLAHIGATPSCDQKYWAWRIMCQRANAAVYVEEGRLEAVRNGIQRGAAELRPYEYISRYERRASWEVSTGLIVCGYQFSDRQPSELAALFTRAIAELKAASR